MQQPINYKAADRETRRYRLFTDPGHGWLEVSRAEVVASGATISAYSYYDPTTDMAYLEEDRDVWAFLKALGRDWASLPVLEVASSMPRRLPPYGAEAFIDSHIFVVRPRATGRA
jgi:hypothetical protein